ncbi:hypothetical protein [Nocardia pseudobrasiliensis]|uniref:PPE family protein n=1 Tax=Nocardia pseudobrasiliensis TaxID=45979 RepID=A0A370IB19_9NOCA|nr:hypothetical protein [Nocardia pseudobrasiliensis]RDI66594.1 hypothetical protein DFR76_104344 [Nocardia pseudobrasiliensis]
MTYEDYRRRIIDAQQQWNAERDWIYKTQAQGKYGQTFEGDMQPPHVKESDGFDHMSLEDMQKSVRAMKPQLVHDAITAWSNIGMQLMSAFGIFEQEFARTISGANGHSGWTGVAAGAASDAVQRYSSQSMPLSQAATAIGLKLMEMRTGIEETQALMPGDVPRAIVTGKALPKDGIMKVDDHNRQEAEEEARRILRTVYGQVVVQTDNGMPFMPAPPEIGGVGKGLGEYLNPGENGGQGPGELEGGGKSEGSLAGQQGGQGGADPAGRSQEPGQQATTPASAGGDSTTPSSASAQNTGQTTQSGSTGMTAGNNPNSVGGQGAWGPGYDGTARAPAAPGGSRSSSGRPGGMGESAGRAPGGPGRSVPGGPLTGAKSAMPRAAMGSAGAPGTPGMGAPGHAGKGKDEQERSKGIPDYLITQDHGDELIGSAGLPGAVPPVIGGDYDTADRFGE